jgi:DNA-binding beta-propeller fold protein YncE
LLDTIERLAFIACDGNARLLVLDLKSRKILSAQQVGEEPDVMALDPQRKLLYVAGERGVLSLFQIGDHGLKKLGEGFVGENAHTVSVDPETGLVYLPLRNVNGHPALRILAFSGAAP